MDAHFLSLMVKTKNFQATGMEDGALCVAWYTAPTILQKEFPSHSSVQLISDRRHLSRKDRYSVWALMY